MLPIIDFRRVNLDIEAKFYFKNAWWAYFLNFGIKIDLFRRSNYYQKAVKEFLNIFTFKKC